MNPELEVDYPYEILVSFADHREDFGARLMEAVGRFKADGHRYKVLPDSRNECMVFLFENARAATLFKLTYGGN